MRHYCPETFHALLHYAALGLPPGRFAEALLINDLALAYRTAPHTLVPRSRGGDARYDIVSNMFALVRSFPPPLHGNKARMRAWIDHGGYRDAPHQTRTLVMMYSEPWFIKGIETIHRTAEA